MFFLNQKINPTTTSNPKSKSKPRLNITDIKPSSDIKPRYKTLPYSLISLVHCARMSLETSILNTIENNCFASSCDSSFFKFTLSTPDSFSFFSTFDTEPKPEPAKPKVEPVLAANIHFSTVAGMSSHCKHRGDSFGETVEAPVGVSLGFLRLGSGGGCCILILRVILRSSSS